MDIANLPATDITAGQLADIIIEKLKLQTISKEPVKYIRGLESLADLLNVSVSTILRHRKKGTFGDSIKQNGRIILIDKEEAQKLFFQKKTRNKVSGSIY